MIMHAYTYAAGTKHMMQLLLVQLYRPGSLMIEASSQVPNGDSVLHVNISLWYQGAGD